jgi:hypothetical protein
MYEPDLCCPDATPSQNGPPPSRSVTVATKLAKQASIRYIPDLEGEVPGAASREYQEHARMPLDSVSDPTKRSTFYLRQRSTDPDVGSSEQGQNRHHDGNKGSYCGP